MKLPRNRWHLVAAYVVVVPTLAVFSLSVTANTSAWTKGKSTRHSVTVPLKGKAYPTKLRVGDTAVCETAGGTDATPGWMDQPPSESPAWVTVTSKKQAAKLTCVASYRIRSGAGYRSVRRTATDVVRIEDPTRVESLQRFSYQRLFVPMRGLVLAALIPIALVIGALALMSQAGGGRASSPGAARAGGPASSRVPASRTTPCPKCIPGYTGPTGMMVCPRCHGSGQTYTAGSNGVEIQCPLPCGGTGEVPCTRCRGLKEI